MSTLEEITIAMSHEDFDTWSTLTVGFNYTKSLVICLTFYDYKNVQHHTYAIIEKDEAMAMSEQLNVKLTDLPQAICKHCGDTSYVFVPSHVDFSKMCWISYSTAAHIIAYQEIKDYPQI